MKTSFQFIKFKLFSKNYWNSKCFIEHERGNFSQNTHVGFSPVGKISSLLQKYSVLKTAELPVL